MRPLKIAIATVLIGILSMSCAGSREFRLTGSQDIPAAQGTATVSTSDNGNTKIDLVVEHLAPPDRVDPGATVYLVWARGSDYGKQPQNLGALKVDSNLNGSMTAMTPLRSFDLYITAEASQSSTTPMGKTLLQTMIAMK